MTENTNPGEPLHETTERLTTETRSDPQVIYDGMQAVGAITAGVGTLGLGAAAVKKVFVSGDNGAQAQAPPPPEPKQDG